MYYILVNRENNFVDEVIASSHPDFPNVPLSERYTQEFIASLIPSDVDIPTGWVFDPDSKTFSEPIHPEPVEEMQMDPACDGEEGFEVLHDNDVLELKKKVEQLEKQIKTLQEVKQ